MLTPISAKPSCRRSTRPLTALPPSPGKPLGFCPGDPAAGQLQGILDDLGTALTEAENALDSTQGALVDLTGQLSRVSTDLNAIKNSRLYQNFLSTTGIKPEQVAAFMESPVEVETEKIYPVANYGSALAPFTATWPSGSVVLFSSPSLNWKWTRMKTLKPHTHTSLLGWQWLLYITVGLLQGLVVARRPAPDEKSSVKAHRLLYSLDCWPPLSM